MSKGWLGKRVLILLWVLAFSITGLLAQSVYDDTEQLLLDVQKLSELKQILQEMYQAYTITHQGYESIKSLSQGTFSLHKAFLDGLLAVNPAVASYWKVADIVNKEALLVKEAQAANSYLKGSGVFNSTELGIFLTRYNNLIEGSLDAVTELVMVVTAGTLRMSDAERLAAIDRIDGNVTRSLGVTNAFYNDAALQAMQRARQQQDIGTVQGLYGIGP
jgi:hypothetical protein